LEFLYDKLREQTVSLWGKRIHDNHLFLVSSK